MNAIAISEEQEPNGVDDDGIGIVRSGRVQGSEGVGKRHKEEHGDEEDATCMFTLLDLCVSSLRRGRANIICIVPITCNLNMS